MSALSKVTALVVNVLSVLTLVLACVVVARTVHNQSGNDWQIIVLP